MGLEAKIGLLVKKMFGSPKMKKKLDFWGSSKDSKILGLKKIKTVDFF